MKNAEKIVQLHMRSQYNLIYLMSFVTLLLQMVFNGVLCFNQDLVALLLDWLDAADLLQVREHNFPLLSFIWKSNYIETIETLLFVETTPVEILEYVRLHNLILESIAYQLSMYLAIILLQLLVCYKSQLIISFHKITRTISSAVIAVP